jgi:hypothetical protein
VLTVSSSQILRLRHNPFFAYVEERIEAAIDAARGAAPAASPQ